MKELISDGGDCRTAPATQDLINIKKGHCPITDLGQCEEGGISPKACFVHFV